jgi:hypothetical protein
MSISLCLEINQSVCYELKKILQDPLSPTILSSLKKKSFKFPLYLLLIL